VPDEAFDDYLPKSCRSVSSTHWTPLVVIRRIAEWVNALEIESIVDIGSGAGKLCVALALATECECIGIERRKSLVRTSRELAGRFGVGSRVSFIEGSIADIEIPRASAYYLFNPFEENLVCSIERIDEEVPLSAERYNLDVAFTKRFFRDAPVGTYVIKYNGFGARMPGGYEQVLVDRAMPNVLRVWRKTRNSRSLDS
jgi:SAM-dependent methyltransferase